MMKNADKKSKKDKSEISLELDKLEKNLKKNKSENKNGHF